MTDIMPSSSPPAAGPPGPPSADGPAAGPAQPALPAASAPGAVPSQLAAGVTDSSSSLAPAPPPPALLPALALFERGDFRATRRELDRLITPADASTAGPPEVRAAVRSLRRRLDIDPAAFIVGGIALGLLVLVATTYL